MSTFKTPSGTVLPILNLKGKDYLQVAHRLVWFREEKPNWRIHTEFLHLDNDYTIAKASILDDSGNTIATGHKREDRGHFADHMEKAEAGAIGRALAYIGYGTQFCADEISEGARIVDAPLDRSAKPNGSEPMDRPENFEIKFGKYAGLTVGEAVDKLGHPEFQKYLNWVKDSAQKAGKSVSFDAQSVINNYSQLLQRIRNQDTAHDAAKGAQ